VRRSVVMAGAATAVVGCGALIAVTGCRDAGGVREEGTVAVSSPAASRASLPPPVTGARTLEAAGTARTGRRLPDAADVVRLVEDDPKVTRDIRDSLETCAAPSASAADDARPDPAAVPYPVDHRFGRLTGEDGTDLVVNVSTCADSVGLGSDVYRRVGGRYVNVFADEQPPVFAGMGDGTLKVTHQVYEPQDSVSNPSGEDVTTYRWNGTRFQEISFSHRDYETRDDGTGDGSHG
jgi:hypothetical protein